MCKSYLRVKNLQLNYTDMKIRELAVTSKQIIHEKKSQSAGSARIEKKGEATGVLEK